MEKHPLHLKNPELQTSPEVNRAVKREESRATTHNHKLQKSNQEGPLERERIPNDPAERIEAYMDRLENIFLNPDERIRKRNLELFRDKIYDTLIIKKENFPESYFELQQRVARERGQAVEEIPKTVREQMMDVAIKDQKASLDAWMNYFTSNDAVYPPWFKYFVWRNITKLSQFDKARGEFKKRTDSTVAPYPDIYREPLAQIADIYEQVKKDTIRFDEPDIRQAFGKKFPALYAELISKSLAASMEGREEIRGEWVKYEKGKDGEAAKLFASLDGKGTGWCTAGQSTAEAQIQSGDFYVYYTYDADGKPVQPRLAIRMDGDSKIGEVRGILLHQAVEPVMQEVLDKKLRDFGGEADAYRKKSEDMRRLTEIDKKHEKGELFDRDDLVFLYEINDPIEGFGYQKDPRVAELRKDRNPEDDMLVIFECTKEEIAHVPSQIRENTKAYVGQLEPGIFQKLPEGFEHVYTSFPEGKVHKYTIEIGGKTKDQLKAELVEKNIYVSDWANQLLESRDFTVLKSMEKADLVRLTVKDLGFSGTATTDEIYQRAKELGLELCPAEVGPQLRLAYSGSDWMYIAMKQITDRDGDPHVFLLDRAGAGLKLRALSAGSGDQWASGSQFVFLLRKKKR